MAYGRLSLLLTKRRFSLHFLNPKTPFLHSHLFSTSQNPNPKPSSLSARLSFVFDQIDAIEKERSQKHETLQRIRAWRDSKNTQNEIPEQPVSEPVTTASSSSSHEEVKIDSSKSTELVKKEVELVHPWPEWIQLMERLVHQNYFDHKRKDEDKMVQDLGFDTPEIVHDEGFDFTKDFKSVHAACLNFGKDRFDLLRSLSRQDIQILVGFGCPNVDRKVVFSGKLLRKLVHLDEGDVCSSCSLRNNCDNAYLLTNKEDEARTIDIMRMLLTFGFDPINGSVLNKPLLKQKSVKAVVRKLLHEVVKLSSVPIDPNLPPPVIKKPPPKVKQPPPTPKRRVGRDDVEMKRGDWLCPKCDFMNFAKNNVCLQCDAKRPKRQLLPGEWECAECNFLNYRRNVVCFHCECKRPPDEFLENKVQDKMYSSGPNFNKTGSRQEVSNAWNFDFDDNESDGADVAAFEYADSHGIDKDFPSDNNARRVGWEDDFEKNSRVPGSHDEEYVNPGPSRPRTGFDDFDDEDDIDSYELDTQTGSNSARTEATKSNFSETEDSLDWEDSEDMDDKMHAHHKNKTAHGRTERTHSVRKNTSFSQSKDDELDYDSDEQRSILSNFKYGHVSAADQKRNGRGPTKKLSFGSDSDEDGGAGLYSDEDDDLNEAYSSRQNKGNRHDSGRRNFTKDGKFGGGYKSNIFSDDFDESPRQSYRNGRGSQGNSRDRKRFEDFDGSSRKSYGNDRGSQGSNRDRKRFDDFDGSSRKSYANDRGSQGGSRDRKRFDDFDGSSRKSYGNDRRSQGSNCDRKRFDDFDGSSRKSYGNDRGSRGNGRSRQKFDDREHGRGQFNKYSMDEKGDGDFRNSRRVIER
ncbi:zinc finger protein VAR3, chloroplastic [Trifolium repens]|nr:zinc finger protein VAR3, chloroplastic [Trifolium repens]